MAKENIKTEKDIREYLKGWSDFEVDVYLATFQVPKGKVSTYGRIAEKIGRPDAYRAVANALHKNPLHPIVPCHRIVTADGKFSGNPEQAAKRRVQVREEGVPIQNGRVRFSKGVLY